MRFINVKSMKRKISVKERILLTASHLFYHQGFNSTGINQIIAEAGIAIGSLYKHYRSKNDLLYRYLQYQDAIFFTNLDAELKEVKQPVDQLLRMIDYRIALQNREGFAGCHFIKINAELGRSDREVEQLVVSHKQRQRDYLRHIVGSINLSKGALMKQEIIVDAIFLMIEGAVVSSSMKGHTEDLARVKEVVSGMV